MNLWHLKKTAHSFGAVRTRKFLIQYSLNIMAAIYLNDHKNFPDLLKIIAEETGILVGLVEKDYWIMQSLYGLKKQGYVFQLKGGTSLLKGFGRNGSGSFWRASLQSLGLYLLYTLLIYLVEQWPSSKATVAASTLASCSNILKLNRAQLQVICFSNPAF